MDVHIFTPKYGEMTLPEGAKLHLDVHWLRVPKEDTDNPPVALQSIRAADTRSSIICNVVSLTNESEVTLHFLENREYYELRANVFGYKDDHIRFALLSKATLEWLLYCKKSNPDEAWFPDIIHCHDWHTGYLIDYAKRDPRYKEMLKDVKLIFTIHNLAYQGNYDFRYNLDKFQDDGKKRLFGLLDPKLQKQNALLRGIVLADGVNTVSPTHAREILTPEFGEGLDTYLEKHKEKLSGITNGLDFTEFNPMTDEHITRNFDVNTFISARNKNKADLQEVFGLPVDEKALK
jgi:starch synthase